MIKGSVEHREYMASRGKELKPLREKVFSAWTQNPDLTILQIREIDPALNEISPTTLTTWKKRCLIRASRETITESNEDDIVVQCQNIVQAYLDKYVAVVDRVKALNKEIGQQRAELQEKAKIISGLEGQIKLLKDKMKSKQRPLDALRAMALPGD